MKDLSTQSLCEEARAFAEAESSHHEPRLFGVTDGITRVW